METLQTVVAEFEAVIDVDTVMDQGRHVDDGVLAAKVLQDALATRLLLVVFCRVDDAIDHVLVLRDDEAVNTFHSEVEVVNVCDGSQSDELLEGYDWIFNRT